MSDTTDSLYGDAYIRGVALGFPQGDMRRWTLCRSADRLEALQDENTKLRAERDALKVALREIDLKAEAGLCYFTLESARGFLKDIRALVAQEQTP